MTLPENAVKELLSRAFVRLVATTSHFIVSTDEIDFGTDLCLSHVDAFDDGEKVRYSKSGFGIDVQVKATCERQVRTGNGVLKYDLRAANYNDLVRRRASYVPLILVLFVLPDEPVEWLAVAESEMTLRKCGYVWRPTEADGVVANTGTKTITIPLTSRLAGSTFDDIREQALA